MSDHGIFLEGQEGWRDGKGAVRNTADASFRRPESDFLSPMAHDASHARCDIRNDRGHDEDLGC